MENNISVLKNVVVAGLSTLGIILLGTALLGLSTVDGSPACISGPTPLISFVEAAEAKDGFKVDSLMDLYGCNWLRRELEVVDLADGGDGWLRVVLAEQYDLDGPARKAGPTFELYMAPEGIR